MTEPFQWRAYRAEKRLNSGISHHRDLSVANAKLDKYKMFNVTHVLSKQKDNNN